MRTIKKHRILKTIRTSLPHRFPVPYLAVLAGILGFCIAFPGFIKNTQAQTPPPFQTSSVELTAYPAFEGNFKYGEWLPVFVLLSNNGPDISGDVRIPIRNSGGMTIYSARVELPAGARKLITIYALPNNFSRQLNVELYVGEDLLISKRVSVQPNPNLNFFVGILSPQRGALALINTVEIPGIRRPKVLVDIPLDQVPGKSEGLGSFDMIVINDEDTSVLTPEQKIALEAWVRQGGRLVIGGGTSAQTTVSGLPETLFPAAVSPAEPRDKIPAIEAFAGDKYPILVPGPFMVAEIHPVGGRALAGEEDASQIHEWSMGSGFVNYIALDPSISPFDAWNGAAAFWGKLILPWAVYPEELPTDMSQKQLFASNMPYALSNLPVLDLPSARGLAVMLIIYVLLVGPVNYLVLQRMKRLQLAWVTIPLITLVFSAASFGMGYLLHGTDIFINKISLIQIAPDGDAKLDSYFGVFSPAQTAYQVEVTGGGLVSPLSPYYDPWGSMNQPVTTGRSIQLVQGEPAIIKGLSIDQWSMQSFMSEGTIAGFGVLGADLVLQDDGLVGTIENSTNYTLEDAVIIQGGKFVRLGTIEPGETKNVSLSLSEIGLPDFTTSLSYAIYNPESNPTISTFERRKAESRRVIVENIFERSSPMISSRQSSGSELYGQNTPVFLGWIDQAPPDVSVVGAETSKQTTAAVLFPLSYKLPDSGRFTIPAGLIPGKMISAPLEGGSCGISGRTAVYISRGEAVLEYNIPDEVSIASIESLKLGLWSDSGVTGPMNADLYDWAKQSWVGLTGLSTGVNILSDPAPFINSDGVVQVRIGNNSMVSCVYVLVGLEAKQP